MKYTANEVRREILMLSRNSAMETRSRRAELMLEQLATMLERVQAKGAQGLAAEVKNMLDDVGRCRDGIAARIAELDAKGAQGEALVSRNPSPDAASSLIPTGVTTVYAAPLAAVPDGMKLVPIEPTSEMIQAALDDQEHDPEDGPASEVYCMYKAMLSCAPFDGGE